ncbi:MAG TPA: thiamine phosphate synthase [Longimicrobium sp.]|nr:thiamine phosphate synthase [Longimicrobium sp.]
MSELADRLALIVVTDPDCGAGRSVVEVVRAALRGGAPAIQLRAKEMGAREMTELARALIAETRTAGALLFVNDRVDVALAAGADGAHLGDDDLPLAAARRIAPPGFLLGMSADSPEGARAAERDGADYVGVGPVYGTASKADAGDAIGTARIAEVAAAVRIPVVGIGGIAIGNARPVIEAGAAGVAVISAVVRAADPEAATRALVGEVVGNHGRTR